MDKIPRKVLVGKFYGRRLVGRPRLRWKGIGRGLLYTAEYRRMEESSSG
jgi:hypothetical protein